MVVDSYRRLTLSQAQRMVTPQKSESSWMRVVSCFALVAVTVAGCGEDLGTCQMDAATQVIYASNGTPYYAGQGLVQAGCAEGVCHSVYAENATRRGAPHGLNFDVAPLTSGSSAADISALRDGISHVRDNASELWGEISAETMPPGEAGKRGDQTWKAANGDAVPLTNIDTDLAKATIRNWLACGAPLVAGVTGAASAASSLGRVVDPLENMSTDAPTFATVYDTVFSTCKTCHNGTVVKLGLDLTTATTAYATLVDKAAFTGGGEGKCGSATQKLVTPGKCQESLVYLKLRPNPPCGDQMPIGPALPAASVQLLCDWIDAGATK
jgi:hypothetical protein